MCNLDYRLVKAHTTQLEPGGLFSLLRKYLNKYLSFQKPRNISPLYKLQVTKKAVAYWIYGKFQTARITFSNITFPPLPPAEMETLGRN